MSLVEKRYSLTYIAPTMLILSIETSCDETAVSIVKVTGKFPEATYEILGDALFSQVDIHKEYGGVFPALAKREHVKTIVPMIEKALKEAGLLVPGTSTLKDTDKAELTELLNREEEMVDALISFFENYEQPAIDLIAVTSGPGLEPALWVGVNTAKALAKIWQIPVSPTNHMEGHILASIYAHEEDKLSEIKFPALALLISGGHTEIVLMKNWGKYEKIGETRDDAIGEAFDKVARLLGLPYPGGPEISKLANKARIYNYPPFKKDMPRPMINSGDLDFSFSGIKTSVRYAVEGKELSLEEKSALARDFEDAVTEVLLAKTKRAIIDNGIETLIVGGGVSANLHIRQTFTSELPKTFPELKVYFPIKGLATDNSIMIALAGHAKMDSALTPETAKNLRASGNRSL